MGIQSVKKKVIEIINNRYTPFWLLSISVIIALVMPMLVQDGMFMDAMLYTSVSHNLSHGMGTFWHPYFSYGGVASLPSFHEQPPLVFGIQALFFKLFGDSMYVERFYTFVTLVVTAWLMVVLWRRIFKGEDLKKLSWLPLILWIMIPVCYWSYRNNMHENTMGIFTLASVLFSYQAMRLRSRRQLGYFILSGFFIFLATMSKGFPGFFPIVLPFLYWLCIGKIKFPKVIWTSAILLAVPALLYVVLFLYPESNDSLSIYLFKRAFHRIQEAPTVGNRFYILRSIFFELIPSLLLVAVILAIGKIKKIKPDFSRYGRQAVFFILLGFAGSVPLMLTMVQKRFYFVPSLPFFAIGLAILAAPTLFLLIENMKYSCAIKRTLLTVTSLLFVGTIVFSCMQVGKYSREPDVLHDIHIIGKIIPEKSIVSCPSYIRAEDWSLQCYLMRYYYISMDYLSERDYYIRDRKVKNIPPPENYTKMEVNLERYDLYKKNPDAEK